MEFAKNNQGKRGLYISLQSATDAVLTRYALLAADIDCC